MEKITLEQIRRLVVENCMLKVEPETIQDDTPLFGPGSLGLDSIDALQLTLAIERDFGTPIHDAEMARQILKTPETIRLWVDKQKALAS